MVKWVISFHYKPKELFTFSESPLLFYYIGQVRVAGWPKMFVLENKHFASVDLPVSITGLNEVSMKEEYQEYFT